MACTRRIPLEERFWPKVDVRGPDDCWPWIGAPNKSGYATIGMGGRDGGNRMAHRVAYELLVGAIPDGLHIDHLCKNRSCMNPAHMEPVLCGVNVIRGEGLSAQNARKTHCKRGHEFTPKNTYVQPNRPGTRNCLTCRRDANRRRYAGA